MDFIRANPWLTLHAAHRVAILEVAIEEVENRFVCADLVGLLRESVALVVKQHVFNNAAALLDILNNLIRLRLDHARIVRTLQHDQRLHDVVGMKQRRNCPQVLLLRTRIANLLIERLPE